MSNKTKDKKTVVVKVGTGYLFKVNSGGYLSLEADNWDGLVEELAAIHKYANITLVHQARYVKH